VSRGCGTSSGGSVNLAIITGQGKPEGSSFEGGRGPPPSLLRQDHGREDMTRLQRIALLLFIHQALGAAVVAQTPDSFYRYLAGMVITAVLFAWGK
jgi:hypothetical protein